MSSNKGTNIELKSAYNRYLSQYVDRYGFTTYNQVSLSDPDIGFWDSDNNHLWTGQMNLLLDYHGLLDDTAYNIQLKYFEKTYKSTRIMCGLNVRHAPINLYLKSSKWDAISLDEHDGMLFSSSVLVEAKFMTREVLWYGSQYGWAFVEHYPAESATPKTVKEFVNLLKGIWAVLKFAIVNKDFAGSGAMDSIIFKYKEVEKLSRVRLPKERAFIRLMHNKRPGLIAYLHLCGSMVYAAYKDKVSGQNRNFYRILALRKAGCKRFLFRVSAYLFNRKLTKVYGTNDYLSIITDKYLHNKDHPFHELTEGVTL